MSPRTIFLSRFIGLYCILAPLALVLHKDASIATVNALVNNPPEFLVFGVITLGTGLAMVLSHNIWSGGALPVIVTLVGWIALLKGLSYLFLTPEAVSGLLGTIHYQQNYALYAAFSILLGVYLTYSGFNRASR